jgi:hypothetical protein
MLCDYCLFEFVKNCQFQFSLSQTTKQCNKALKKDLRLERDEGTMIGNSNVNGICWPCLPKAGILCLDSL